MWSVDKSVKFLIAHEAFNRVLNTIRIISVQNGALSALLTVSENEADEHGIMHRGFTATAVDVLTSVSLKSLMEKQINCVSVEMNFSFIESAKIGDEVLIETRILRKGRSLAYLEADLRNKKTNNLLVKGSQVVYLLNK